MRPCTCTDIFAHISGPNRHGYLILLSPSCGRMVLLLSFLPLLGLGRSSRQFHDKDSVNRFGNFHGPRLGQSSRHLHVRDSSNRFCSLPGPRLGRSSRQFHDKDSVNRFGNFHGPELARALGIFTSGIHQTVSAICTVRGLAGALGNSMTRIQ